MCGFYCGQDRPISPERMANIEATRAQKAQHVKDNHITIFEEGDYSVGLKTAHNFNDPDCTKCFHFVCEKDCYPEDTTLAKKCKKYYPPFKKV